MQYNTSQYGASNYLLGVPENKRPHDTFYFKAKRQEEVNELGKNACPCNPRMAPRLCQLLGCLQWRIQDFAEGVGGDNFYL